LSDAKVGTYKIKTVKKLRLIEIGFISGSKIKVIKNNKRLVVEIKGSRFALGSEITDEIEIV
ncbi:MAG: ferrous iron transport protein A, partial [Candidatus Altiarchaeota archaeon]|nr:ferrous iron transport protein A [Candidatus Altiarchaeota archaeon]